MNWRVQQLKRRYLLSLSQFRRLFVQWGNLQQTHVLFQLFMWVILLTLICFSLFAGERESETDTELECNFASQLVSKGV